MNMKAESKLEGLDKVETGMNLVLAGWKEHEKGDGRWSCGNCSAEGELEELLFDSSGNRRCPECCSEEIQNQ